jgi:hypothetical protein
MTARSGYHGCQPSGVEPAGAVMIRRGLKLGLFASLLCLLAGVHNVSAQGDPLELQRRDSADRCLRRSGWLVWEGKDGVTFLVQREAQHRRSLLTLPRADVTEIEIVGVEPILPIIFGGR